jgi:hypothetical protein
MHAFRLVDAQCGLRSIVIEVQNQWRQLMSSLFQKYYLIIGYKHEIIENNYVNKYKNADIKFLVE